MKAAHGILASQAAFVLNGSLSPRTGRGLKAVALRGAVGERARGVAAE
jgi:hypothetical protein